MKKLLSLILCLAFLPLFAAQAEGASFACDVHPEVKVFFSQNQFKDLNITNYIVAQGTQSGDYAFAIGRKNEQNFLYGFEKKNDQFQYWLLSGTALPHQKGTFSLWIEDEWTYYSSSEGHSRYVKGPVLLIEWHAQNEETQKLLVFSTEGTSGQWRLRYVNQISTEKNTPVFSVLTYEDHLHYLTQTGTSVGKAYGNVQTNLRYLNLSALPATLTDAQNKLSSAPSLPQSSELTGQEISFTGGQKFPVYSGPGTNYVRAANGKATVSTNDWIQVFGTENGYALIQYAINANHMRFGYIDASALPKSASISALSFDQSSAVLLHDCSLTDDPLYTREAVLQLRSGDAVTWLALMGDDVYIEVDGASPQRGFVKKESIRKIMNDAQLEGAFEGEGYAAYASLTIQGGEALADVLVESTSKEYLPDGYALLCNQSIRAWKDDLLSLSPVSQYFAGKYALSFSLHVSPLDESTQIIALCPLYDGQYRLEEAIQFILP